MIGQLTINYLSILALKILEEREGCRLGLKHLSSHFLMILILKYHDHVKILTESQIEAIRQK